MDAIDIVRSIKFSLNYVVKISPWPRSQSSWNGAKRSPRQVSVNLIMLHCAVSGTVVMTLFAPCLRGEDLDVLREFVVVGDAVRWDARRGMAGPVPACQPSRWGVRSVVPRPWSWMGLGWSWAQNLKIVLYIWSHIGWVSVKSIYACGD